MIFYNYLFNQIFYPYYHKMYPGFLLKTFASLEETIHRALGLSLAQCLQINNSRSYK